MMRKILMGIVLIGIFSPFISVGQGINFENLESWSSLLFKAKSEGKILFVDCYTTWCAPCETDGQGNVY